MRNKALLSVLLVSLMTASVACGPKEKPVELVELERVRATSEAAELNVEAPEAYARTTQLYRDAVNAWSEGQNAKAASLANLGQRQYVTAKAEKAYKEATANIALYTKEIKENQAAIKKLESEKEKAEANLDKVRKEMAAAGIAGAEIKVQAAINERDRALSVNARDFAVEAFKAADDALKIATDAIVASDRKVATQAATEATSLFVKAYEIAKPEFEKNQQNLMSAERQKALVLEAQGVAGPASVFTDMKGVVVVIPGSFDFEKTAIKPMKLDTVHSLCELAKKYPETTIIIEGYTQERSRNPFEVSQMRADAVRDIFLTRGIDSQRLMTTAKAKENQRYNNRNKTERELNDRFEVTFIFP